MLITFLIINIPFQVWSDSELVETEPVKIPSLPPIPVESDVKTVKRSSKEVGVRKSGRTSTNSKQNSYSMTIFIFLYFY